MPAARPTTGSGRRPCRVGRGHLRRPPGGGPARGGPRGRRETPSIVANQPGRRVGRVSTVGGRADAIGGPPARSKVEGRWLRVRRGRLHSQPSPGRADVRTGRPGPDRFVLGGRAVRAEGDWVGAARFVAQRLINQGLDPHPGHASSTTRTRSDSTGTSFPGTCSERFGFKPPRWPRAAASIGIARSVGADSFYRRRSTEPIGRTAPIAAGTRPTRIA